MPKKKEFITEQDFLNKVIPKPENRDQDGEYFKGGECNYGGRHILKEDIARINLFFEEIFNTLNAKKPRELKNEGELNDWKLNQINKLNSLISKCSQDDKTTLGDCCLAWSVYWGSYGSKKTDELKKTLIARKISVEKMKWTNLEEYIGNLKNYEQLKGEVSELMKNIKTEQDPEELRKLKKRLKERENEFINLEAILNNSPFTEIENQELTATDILNGFKDRNKSGLGSTKTQSQPQTQNFLQRNRDNIIISSVFLIISLLVFYFYNGDN